MNYKHFVFKVLLIVIVVLTATSSFIYLIDPLWMFSSSNRFNQVQTVIDEREQKTIAIKYQPFPYDSLLLGSSRSTYINQHDFKGMDVYNFSVSNMSVREYNSFLEYAKERRGKEFKNVIIGLDFFKTSLDQSSALRTLDNYIEKEDKPFFRTKNFFSWDVLKYAYGNFKMSLDGKVVDERNYNRDNVAVAKKIDPEKTEKQTEAKIQKFKHVFYGKTYEYNPYYASYLRQLKKNNPNTNFIVFTTPISSELFQALVESKRLPDYNRWINDVVSVFGEVHNFMYPNSITNNINNYFDGHHYYPEVGTLIAKSLSNDTNGVPADFGKVLTPGNYRKELAIINKEGNRLVAEKSAKQTGS
ncbi:hypothetical protein [Bacillus testis]|uniref:hypothetical protein n=1 Tax=Bacillus testis TaxID=1622072 RepID=UPI00067F52D3|nr:hypothetical protein [Bacillus testis]